jgi:hypothetical protein
MTEVVARISDGTGEEGLGEGDKMVVTYNNPCTRAVLPCG